jgi:protein phosphatase
MSSTHAGLTDPGEVRGPFRWTSASCSHAGLVRKTNEDACLDQPERGLWAVADGMGGHAMGDFASRLVIDVLRDAPAPATLAHFMADARDRLQTANRQLRTEAAMRGVAVIGSTVAVLLACGRHCGYLWAGDSRIYLCRNGRLTRLTRDHSQAEAVRSLHDPSSEVTLLRPPSNLITRAVGAADTLELDSGAIEVIDGDVFLLCSDGLSNEVCDLDIGRALLPGNCHHASEALLDMALERGGHDNISVVLVRAEDLYSADSTAINPVFK